MGSRAINRTAIVALALGLLLLLFEAVRQRRDQVNTRTLVRVQLKWKNQAQFAGFYVAQAKGYYKDEGLDVQLIEGGLDSPAIQAVTSNSADFGLIGPEAILLARSRGVDVTALAVIYQKSPFCLFTYANYGISKVEELRGKAVGVLYGSNELIGYRAMLRRAHLDGRKDLKEILVQYDLNALRTGAVQAFPGYWIDEADDLQEKCDDEARLGQTNPCQVIQLKGSDTGLMGDTLFTSGRYIKEHPDVVRRFTSATLKGWKDAIGNQADAIKATLAQKSDAPMKSKHQCLMLQKSVAYICPGGTPCKLGHMDYTQWEVLKETLLDVDLLPKGSEVDLPRAFDSSFVDSANVIVSDMSLSGDKPCS